MTERPEQDTGPRVRATIYLPPELWQELQVDALRRGSTASALVAEMLVEYLEASPDRQTLIAERAKRWMRPKGGAARGDGDGDSA